MGIRISQGFTRTSGDPIDETLTLTLAQMKALDDAGMPDKYFTICQDDGKLYLYNKDNTVDETTGKFRKMESGGGGTGTDDYLDLDNKPQINSVTLQGNKTSSDLKLQDEMDAITNHEIDQIIFG